MSGWPKNAPDNPTPQWIAAETRGGRDTDLVNLRLCSDGKPMGGVKRTQGGNMDEVPRV